MMKKAAILLLLFVALFTVPQTAQATTTFYWGGFIGGRETFDDSISAQHFTGSLSAGIIGFTYIKRLKICIEHESGESVDNNNETRFTGLTDYKIGYPVVNGKKELLYITAGFLEYSRSNFSRATGGMLGVNIISVLNETVLLEMDFQYSALHSEYRIYSTLPFEPPPLSMEMTSVKLKIQFILTDHLALIMSYHGIYSNVDNQNVIENIYLPSIGLSYRI
jgi:hypothetical protein